MGWLWWRWGGLELQLGFVLRIKLHTNSFHRGEGGCVMGSLVRIGVVVTNEVMLQTNTHTHTHTFTCTQTHRHKYTYTNTWYTHRVMHIQYAHRVMPACYDG